MIRRAPDRESVPRANSRGASRRTRVSRDARARKSGLRARWNTGRKGGRRADKAATVATGQKEKPRATVEGGGLVEAFKGMILSGIPFFSHEINYEPTRSSDGSSGLFHS